MFCSTTSITDNRINLAVLRVAENTFSRSVEHVLQSPTWCENQSNGNFSLLDVVSDFLRHLVRYKWEFY